MIYRILKAGHLSRLPSETWTDFQILRKRYGTLHSAPDMIKNPGALRSYRTMRSASRLIACDGKPSIIQQLFLEMM